MATKHITLELTTEQEETIKALFLHNGWEYIEIRSRKAVKKNSRPIQSASNSVKRPGPSGHRDPDGDPDPGDNGDDGQGDDDNVENNQRCPMCFLQPCVTQSQSHLGGIGQEPSDCNPSIRKSIYRKFWSVINNLGGWQMDLYVAKKQEEAHRQNIVYMKREIMPECILSFVRGLYPNPAGQPYMGHMWE